MLAVVVVVDSRSSSGLRVGSISVVTGSRSRAERHASVHSSEEEETARCYSAVDCSVDSRIVEAARGHPHRVNESRR